MRMALGSIAALGTLATAIVSVIIVFFKYADNEEYLPDDFYDKNAYMRDDIYHHYLNF